MPENPFGEQRAEFKREMVIKLLQDEIAILQGKGSVKDLDPRRNLGRLLLGIRTMVKRPQFAYSLELGITAKQLRELENGAMPRPNDAIWKQVSKVLSLESKELEEVCAVYRALERGSRIVRVGLLSNNQLLDML